MDGIAQKRKETIEKWFHRADLILRKIYQKPTTEKLEWNDEMEADVKAISISYLANYVGIIDPSLKDHLLVIVSRLADLEIAEKETNTSSKDKPTLTLVKE